MNSEFITDKTSDTWKQIQFTGKLPYITTEYFILSKVKIGLKWYVRKEAKPDHKEINLLNDLLQKEFEIGQQLTHPNIVSYNYCGVDNGNFYVIMDYVDGFTLQEYLISDQKTKLNKQKFLNQFIEDITSALSYLHSKKMVHGDLSPHNIIYSEPLKKMILVDFGHAFYPGYLSLGGGTKEYSAPELQHQLINEKSDIYSFGKILQLITETFNINNYDHIIKKCTHENDFKRIDVIENLKKEFKKLNFRLKVKSKFFLLSFFMMLLTALIVGFIFFPLTKKQSKLSSNINAENKELHTKQSENLNSTNEKKINFVEEEKNKSIVKTEKSNKTEYDTFLNQYNFLTDFILNSKNSFDLKSLQEIRIKCIYETEMRFKEYLTKANFTDEKIKILRDKYNKNYFFNYQKSDSIISHQLKKAY